MCILRLLGVCTYVSAIPKGRVQKVLNSLIQVEVLTIDPGTLQFGSCKQYLSSQHALWMGGHFGWLRMAMCGGCWWKPKTSKGDLSQKWDISWPNDSLDTASSSVLEGWVGPKVQVLWSHLRMSHPSCIWWCAGGYEAHSEHKGIECVTTLAMESMRKWVLFVLDPFNTFKVKIIINPGKSCYVAVGMCNMHYPRSKFPGWEELSVGYLHYSQLRMMVKSQLALTASKRWLAVLLS